MQRIAGTLVWLAAIVLSTTMAWAAVLPIKSSFVIPIGHKTAIYLVRGDCAAPAPAFSTVSGQLPRTSLGKFSDGGTGSRDSPRCKGPVKVRIISFTGTKAGKQTVTFDGQKVTIQVK